MQINLFFCFFCHIIFDSDLISFRILFLDSVIVHLNTTFPAQIIADSGKSKNQKEHPIEKELFCSGHDNRYI